MEYITWRREERENINGRGRKIGVERRGLMDSFLVYCRVLDEDFELAFERPSHRCLLESMWHVGVP